MSVDTAKKSILESFARTTDEIFSLKEFEELLDSNKKIRIKYGVDVTSPYLHIGHAVNLWMMRELQDLGHKVIFLIGDFTTQIGDPTGRSNTRPIISQEEIDENVQNIESKPVWKPMHLQPLYSKYDYWSDNHLKDISANLFRDGLCLPSGSSLSEKDQDRIIGIILSLF